MEKLTISSKIDNEFEFEITASGVDLKTGRVMFCVEVDELLTYQLECTHKVGVQWVVKFPKGVFKNGMHNFNIVVLIEDFYFEPMKGKLTVIDAKAIKITESKDVEVKKKDDKVEVEVEKTPKAKPKLESVAVVKPKLESVAEPKVDPTPIVKQKIDESVVAIKPKVKKTPIIPKIEETVATIKPMVKKAPKVKESVTPPKVKKPKVEKPKVEEAPKVESPKVEKKGNSSKEQIKEAAIKDVISSSFKQSAKSTRNKKKSERRLEKLQEQTIEDAISKDGKKGETRKTFFKTDHPYEQMEDRGAKDKKAREILAGLHEE